MADMTDDQFRMAKFLIEFQQIAEDGMLILDLANAEVASAMGKVSALYEGLYAEMDEAFWEIASHYDNGWDLIRDMGVSQPETPTDNT